MKLATYYQREENHFCRLINLDEQELGGYEKIYVFSESKNYTTVPDVFKRAQNVVFGGSAFTNNKYVPFENKLIDYTLPRTNIYASFLHDKYIAGLKEKEVIHLLDNSYYRWHAGNEILPLPAIKRRHRIYIYDVDFFQEGWRNVINKIMARNPSSIHFIHPAHYSKLSDFLEVKENNLIAKGNDSYLDLNIPLKETSILMKRYKNRLLSVIKPSSQIYLSLGGSFNYVSDYFKDIIYKLNLLYIFWGYNIPMKIKYENPSFGYYDPITDLSQLIATWTQGETNKYKSIIERIPKDKSMTDVRPEREQLKKIIEKYPSSMCLFHQTSETTKKGGGWKYGY